MATKKRHWFWNLLLLLTIIVCLLAFAAHSKNWTQVKPDKIQVLSGFYLKELPFSDLDSLIWVEKIPPMKRLNGFSAFEKGKGMFQEFQDSLTEKKVHVYVDNFKQQKIKVVYQDSLKLYINLKDSVDTVELFDLLQSKLEEEAPN